jgi:chromosome segregation ATPase
MPVRFKSYCKILISLSLILTFCLIEGEAQTRRKKRTRRTARKPAVVKPVITNPPIAPPATTANVSTADVKIISTADSTQTTESAEPVQAKKPKAATSTTAAPEDMQETITNLSNQVNRLADKLSQMQEDDRYQLEMERLTRAEQRAEQLRMQLIDVQSKIADLEAKLEQVEYALKPENIERATQGFGTVHPEEARDTRRRQLESERTRLKAQLKILQTSQVRLEVSCANADNEVDLLRAKLQQRRDQMDAAPPEKESKPKKPNIP